MLPHVGDGSSMFLPWDLEEHHEMPAFQSTVFGLTKKGKPQCLFFKLLDRFSTVGL